MFKELVPVLRNRAVVLTVSALDEDQIRVNVVPKKTKDGDHDALTTPLSVTGTAEELDAQLASTLVGFVASHLQMKNALEKAKSEMDAAAKAAQAEARAKVKAPATRTTFKPELAQPCETPKFLPQTPSGPPRTAGLFDAARSASAPAPSSSTEDESLTDAMGHEENSDEEEPDEAA